MNKFAERLRELRQEKGLSLLTLSKEVGISDVALGRWENNLRTPNIDSLIILAKYFKVSADYLLGLED